MSRIRLGHIWIDRVSFADALERIEKLVDGGRGGAVFTPNVDHVVIAERLPAFREAYAAATLSLVDGQPLVWASRILRRGLPEKISGSDLVPRLLERAHLRGWRIYLLGGGAGSAEAAALFLRRHGAIVAGSYAPPVPLHRSDIDDQVVDRIAATKPQLVLVGLGAPKQELLIHRIRSRIAPAVALGVGAALDFIAGNRRRAPAWMSRVGLEWLHRLSHEPRLARRYLRDDPRFLLVFLRDLRQARRLHSD